MMHGRPGTTTKDGTTEHVATSCPTCGKKLDAGSTVDNRNVAPEPGDYSVCIYCGQGLQYIEGLKLEAIKDTDMPVYALEQIRRVRMAIARVRRWS
jgi:hypothetical protein